MVKQIISFVTENFQIRSCSHDLTKQNFKTGQLKTSVEYYIGNCKGCCQGDVPELEYAERIKAVSQVLNGNVTAVLKVLKQKMNLAAQEYLFEEAQELKTRISALENHQAKSSIVSNSINNVDVFSIEEDGHFAYINYLKVVGGALCQSRMIEVKKKLAEDKVTLLEKAIVDVIHVASVMFDWDCCDENLTLCCHRSDVQKLQWQLLSSFDVCFID